MARVLWVAVLILLRSLTLLASPTHQRVTDTDLLPSSPIEQPNNPQSPPQRPPPKIFNWYIEPPINQQQDENKPKPKSSPTVPDDKSKDEEDPPDHDEEDAPDEEPFQDVALNSKVAHNSGITQIPTANTKHNEEVQTKDNGRTGGGHSYPDTLLAEDDC